MTTSHVITPNSFQPPKNLSSMDNLPMTIPSELPANDINMISDQISPDIEQKILFEHSYLLEACTAQSFSSISTSSSCSTDSSHSSSDSDDYDGPEFILDQQHIHFLQLFH